MDALTWFGLFAVTAMRVCDAFEQLAATPNAGPGRSAFRGGPGPAGC